MNIFLPQKFNLAKVASEQSELKYKLGAVIYDKSRVISIGCNVLKTHPLYANGNGSYFLHAEISAILKAKCDLTGHSIYVWRNYKDGSPALAKPCPDCMKIIIEKNIKFIHFTKSDFPYWETIKLY